MNVKKFKLLTISYNTFNSLSSLLAFELDIVTPSILYFIYAYLITEFFHRTLLLEDLDSLWRRRLNCAFVVNTHRSVHY